MGDEEADELEETHWSKSSNLLTVLSNVKKGVNDAKDEEKVKIYQKVLVEDMSLK